MSERKFRRPNDDDSQLSRFVETARALGCDEDKEKFEAALRKVAAHRPAKRSPKAAKPNKGANHSD
jgi:hypothetical protein